MTNFEDYLINFLLAGLFITAILYFAIGLATNYNLSSDIMGSDKYDLSEIAKAVNETNEDVKSWGELFMSDNIFIATGSLLLFSVWGIMKLMWNSVTTLSNLIFDGVVNVIGINPIAIGVVTVILVLGLLFAGWKKLKQGE